MATLPKVGAATAMGRSVVRGASNSFNKAFPLFSTKKNYTRSGNRNSGNMQPIVQNTVESNILLEKSLIVTKQENEALNRILRTLTMIEDSDLGLGGSKSGIIDTIVNIFGGLASILGIKKLFSGRGNKTPVKKAPKPNEPILEEPFEPKAPEPTKTPVEKITKPSIETPEAPILEKPTIKLPELTIEQPAVKTPFNYKIQQVNDYLKDLRAKGVPEDKIKEALLKFYQEISVGKAPSNIGKTLVASEPLVPRVTSSMLETATAATEKGFASRIVGGALGLPGLAAQLILTPSETGTDPQETSNAETELRSSIIRHQNELD